MNFIKKYHKIIVFILIVIVVNFLIILINYIIKWKSINVNEILENAEMQLDLWNYNKSLELYNQILQKNNNNIQALVWKWQIMIKLWQITEASQLFYKISKIDSNYKNIYKWLVFYTNSNNIGSIKFYEQQDDKYIDKNLYQLLKCWFLYKLKDYDNANLCLDNLFIYEPNNPYWNFLKGSIYTNKTDYSKALNYLNVAYSWWVYNFDIISQKWISLYNMGNFTWALLYLDKAYQMSWDNTWLLYYLWLNNIRTKNFTWALQNFDKILQFEPSNKNVLVEKWNLLLKQKYYKQAISVYDQAYVLDQWDTNILWNKVLALYKIWDLTWYNESLKRLMSNVTYGIHRYTYLWIILWRVWKYKDSIEILNQALKIDNTHKLAHFAMWLDYYMSWDINKAYDSYKKVYWDSFSKNEMDVIWILYLIKEWKFDQANKKNNILLAKNSYDSNSLLLRIYILSLMWVDIKSYITSLSENMPWLTANNIEEYVYNKFNKYNYLNLYYY